MAEKSIKDQAISGFIWKLIENSSVAVVNFVVQVILARLLLPEDFGLIGIVSVFITVLNIFVQTGFSSAIVQKKDLTQTDCSSAFYSGLLLSVLLYILMFSFSGVIARYYEIPDLELIVKLNSITLISGALISVQNALIQRDMKFKLSFYKSLISTFVHATVGIGLSLNGFGVYALVCSLLASNIITVIVVFIVVKWKPSLSFSFTSIKNLFGFSSKVLITGLLNTVVQNIRSLIIGKKYSSSDLGFYNKGSQLPALVMTNVSGSLNSVTFPTLSKFQDDKSNVARIQKQMLSLTSYVVFPVMFGLAALAEPTVLFLLTEKWAESIPYVQLSCFTCMLWVFASVTSSFLAVGKSNYMFILTVIGGIVTFISILLTYSHGVWMLVFGMFISELINTITLLVVFLFYFKVKASYLLNEILKYLITSIVMLFIITSITGFITGNIMKLIVGFGIGVICYAVPSIVFKFESFETIKSIIFSKRKKGSNQ